MKSIVFNIKDEKDFYKYYPIIKGWWQDWNLPIIEPYGLVTLPTHGIIINNDGKFTCAGWLYLTDSVIGIIGNIISCKENIKERKGSIEFLLVELEKLAKSLGCKVIMTPASNPYLRNKLEKLDHGDFAEKNINYFKNI